MKTAFVFLAALLCEGLATFSAPRTFAYVLQADAFAASRAVAVQRLAACGRDGIVLDASFNGRTGGQWTAAEIRAIRAGKPGRRVLAYFSIGEAEDYRGYWRRAWDVNRDGRPDAGAPSWLLAENPDWEGNYKVRYWQKAWQRIILRQLDQAILAGFDGVYLDLVDAFEFFEYNPATRQWIDDRPNPETGRTYRQDMIAWVRRIATSSRSQRTGFLVVPQNGVQLLGTASYRRTIDAIGVEDLFTEGNRLQSRGHIAFALGFLQPFLRSGKPVWVIEYGTRPVALKRSLQGAKTYGFSLLLTDRELKTLGYSP